MKDINLLMFIISSFTKLSERNLHQRLLISRLQCLMNQKRFEKLKIKKKSYLLNRHGFIVYFEERCEMPSENSLVKIAYFN